MSAPIDEDFVFALAAIGTPLDDIAAEVGVPAGTIRSRCPELLRKARARRNVNLLRALWKAAVDQGNVQALKFLAMQFLGFTERKELTEPAIDAELRAELAKRGIPFLDGES